MTRSKLLPLLLGVAVLSPTAVATASIKDPQPNPAMRRGIHDVARVAAGGATASHIKVACAFAAKPGDRNLCHGTFRLTKDGRSADYTLTAKSHVWKVSAAAVEYRVAAKAAKRMAGLPATTDLLGFYQ
ncbi:MAG: hypothetical protein QOF86_1698 [Baekduia sp.]|nr:hypothetical protein [Baekduia sp.]